MKWSLGTLKPGKGTHKCRGHRGPMHDLRTLETTGDGILFARLVAWNKRSRSGDAMAWGGYLTCGAPEGVCKGRGEEASCLCVRLRFW